MPVVHVIDHPPLFSKRDTTYHDPRHAWAVKIPTGERSVLLSFPHGLNNALGTKTYQQVHSSVRVSIMHRGPLPGRPPYRYLTAR